MELTEFAVARPDERVWSSDFESRTEWYREWIKTVRPENFKEVEGWEPKRKGFVQLFFIIKDKQGGLRMTSELVPPDDIINHCQMIRTFWLDWGGYFKWAPDLEKQFTKAGVTVPVPESLTEERSWRLAENEKPGDRYKYDD